MDFWQVVAAWAHGRFNSAFNDALKVIKFEVEAARTSRYDLGAEKASEEVKRPVR